MTLTRNKFTIDPAKIDMARVERLLMSLGLPRKEICVGKSYRRRRLIGESRKNRFLFDRLNEADLRDLLARAHHAYRTLIKTVHPDRRGSQREAARLNAIWARTKHIFAKHGITL